MMMRKGGRNEIFCGALSRADFSGGKIGEVDHDDATCFSS